MFRSIKQWIGDDVHVADGSIGNIHDFYFDEKQWAIRYIVIDIGDWIEDRKVLLTPEEFSNPKIDEEKLPLKSLNKEQIKKSPELNTTLPVRKQDQISLHKYYRWLPYATSPITTEVEDSVEPEGKPTEPIDQMEQDYVELRSTREVMHYLVKGEDGELGEVDDLYLDDEAWKMVYLVLNSRDKLEINKKILITMSWIKWIHYHGQEVFLDLNQQTIIDSPPFDPKKPNHWPIEEEMINNSKKPIYGFVNEK